MEQKDRTVSFAPSIISTITGVAADAKELLISELTLTKLEFEREFVKAKVAAVTVAIGVAFGFIGAISLVLHGGSSAGGVYSGTALGVLWHRRQRICSGGNFRKNQK
jgi:hypothetical protein